MSGINKENEVVYQGEFSSNKDSITIFQPKKKSNLFTRIWGQINLGALLIAIIQLMIIKVITNSFQEAEMQTQLSSKMALANSYFDVSAFDKAILIYKEIDNGEFEPTEIQDIKIKSNIASCLYHDNKNKEAASYFALANQVIKNQKKSYLPFSTGLNTKDLGFRLLEVDHHLGYSMNHLSDNNLSKAKEYQTECDALLRIIAEHKHMLNSRQLFRYDKYRGSSLALSFRIQVEVSARKSPKVAIIELKSLLGKFESSKETLAEQANKIRSLVINKYLQKVLTSGEFTISQSREIIKLANTLDNVTGELAEELRNESVLAMAYATCAYGIWNTSHDTSASTKLFLDLLAAHALFHCKSIESKLFRIDEITDSSKIINNIGSCYSKLAFLYCHYPMSFDRLDSLKATLKRLGFSYVADEYRLNQESFASEAFIAEARQLLKPLYYSTRFSDPNRFQKVRRVYGQTLAIYLQVFYSGTNEIQREYDYLVNIPSQKSP